MTQIIHTTQGKISREPRKSPDLTRPLEFRDKNYLARHGETAWTLSGQHTGRKDLPLTSNGERNASQLGQRLEGLTFGAVFTSPLQRARRTCELAGFGTVAQVDPDLVEWDYGVYEGRRLEEILAERPDWNLFRDGCPGGETPAQIGARADRVLERIRNLQGNVLLFSRSVSGITDLQRRINNLQPSLCP
jgi:broad specificity phosphatase PhoE